MAQGLGGGKETMTDSLDYVNLCREFIDHIRFFDDQSGYFFIYDFNCINVAHGTQKNLQGQNLYNYQDSQGNYVIRGLVDIVKNHGNGVYTYYWNNPVTGKDEIKNSYVIKIPHTNYFIGARYYLN
ncbi:MAG: cache domain-containing protein [Bacteroidetes bacterium]|nr:cache domain-containing protein [Bacteroidota bacterium]